MRQDETAGLLEWPRTWTQHLDTEVNYREKNVSVRNLKTSFNLVHNESRLMTTNLSDSRSNSLTYCQGSHLSAPSASWNVHLSLYWHLHLGTYVVTWMYIQTRMLAARKKVIFIQGAQIKKFSTSDFMKHHFSRILPSIWRSYWLPHRLTQTCAVQVVLLTFCCRISGRHPCLLYIWTQP